MNSRLCLAWFAVLSCTCLSALTSTGYSGEQKPAQIVEKAKNPHSDMLLSCAKACSDCQQACDSCSAHCLMMVAEGKTEHVKTVQLCNDCATICASAAQLVARHGPLMNLICTACADACNQCAAACEKMKEDAHMKRCAEECRKCEKACRTMTGQAIDHKHQSH